MNYHLKKLVDRGFVSKSDGFYFLTDQGKDYSNMLDDDIKYIEKQPKTTVIVKALRKNKEGKVEFLLNRRLRHPYMGKIGRITGKAKFDETLWEAAERELYEETGLVAKELYLEQIYHKIRHREDGTVIQNAIFYIFFTNDVSGEFIEKTQWQENFWATKKEVENSDKYDLYDDLILEEHFKPKRVSFSEVRTLAEGF